MTTSSPLIEICIPVYNGSNFLEECLYSLQNQTLKDFKCVIVDDRSNDHSRLVAKNFTLEDSRFELISHSKNSGGFGKAVQEALRDCQAKYFSWLAHDDYAHTEFLEKSVKFLDDHPSVDYAYTDLTLLNEKSKSYGTWNYPRTWSYEAYTHHVAKTLSGKLPMNGLFRMDSIYEKGLSWVLHRGETFSSDTITAIDMLWKGLVVGKSDAKLYYRIHSANNSKHLKTRLISDLNVIDYLSTYHTNTLNWTASKEQLFIDRIKRGGLDPSNEASWPLELKSLISKIGVCLT